MHVQVSSRRTRWLVVPCTLNAAPGAGQILLETHVLVRALWRYLACCRSILFVSTPTTHEETPHCSYVDVLCTHEQDGGDVRSRACIVRTSRRFQQCCFDAAISPPLETPGTFIFFPCPCVLTTVFSSVRRNRCFRLLGSSKFGKSAALRVADSNQRTMEHMDGAGPAVTQSALDMARIVLVSAKRARRRDGSASVMSIQVDVSL